MNTVVETERLTLNKFTTDDAAFILKLLNDPSWLKNIGDRGVRTLDEARAYLKNGPISSYERIGFGLYLVKLKDKQESIGVCGLLKRDILEDYDLGYALLPNYTGQGYATEAALGVLQYAKHSLGLSRVVAFTLPSNPSSVRVLEKLGMQFERTIQLSNGDDICYLYALNF